MREEINGGGAQEIAFENGQISDFQGLVTLTFDRVILHTVMHHSLSYQISLKSKKLFCGRTDGRTYGTDVAYVRTGGRTVETHFIRSTRRSRPKYTHCDFATYRLIFIVLYIIKQ